MKYFGFRGHFRSGIDSLKHAKLRSFWTMFGIIIGVGAVITIVAIGEGIKNQVSGQIHKTGKDIITVKSSELSFGSSSSASALSGISVSGQLSGADIGAVANANGVQSSAPLTLVSGKVSGDFGKYNRGFVIGTSSDLPSLFNQSLAYGTFFTPDDNTSNVAVIGQSVSKKLFNVDVPLGRTFNFHGQSFVVNGIFNQFNYAPLSQQVDFNDAIFIPNNVAESLTNNTAPTYEIIARADSLSHVKQVSGNISSALNHIHGGNSGYVVLTGSQNLAANNSILDLLTKLIAGVATISLIVAGIGIMNVMLISVSERVREIGIKKAVGATNRQILGQFMVEATLISFIGGLIGVALAFFIDYAIRISTDFRPIISWQIVVIATGISLAVGILAGTIPAIKASYLDPIEALRAE